MQVPETKIRVLLVEDHQLVREALRAMLDRDPELEVVAEAESGPQALEQVAQHNPDIVLMDVALPGANGIEVTQRLCAQSPNSRVLALSSHSDSRYVSGMLRAGASGYVVKASPYEELSRAMRVVASGKTYLCPEVAGDVVALLRRGDAPGSVYEELAPREREVLRRLAAGLSSPAIARELGISPSTVETHRRNLMRKLDLHSVAELTKYALREGLVEPDC